MKKKILFVVDSLNCGGAEKSLVSLLNTFDYEKYDVFLQLMSVEGIFLANVPQEVKILPELDYVVFSKSNWSYKLKHLNYLLKKVKIFFGMRFERKKGRLHGSQAYWKSAKSAFKTVKENFDVAVAWGQGTPTHYVAEKVKAKKLFAVINADYESLGLNRDFDANFYKKYSKIFAVSNKLNVMTKSIFPEFADKIHTLYDINNAELIEQLASVENPFTDIMSTKIVTVGRLVSAKGYDLLIKAAKILKDKSIDYKWFIIGEGPERKLIENEIEKFELKNNVFLLGQKQNPYVYMANADVYVQTSKNEGFCLTLAEARILNTPVISTNFDAVYNQIEHMQNGIITEKNGESIASAIVELLNNDNLREKIIKKLSTQKKGNIEEIDKLYRFIEE